jgi:hypothetical protein
VLITKEQSEVALEVVGHIPHWSGYTWIEAATDILKEQTAKDDVTV